MHCPPLESQNINISHAPLEVQNECTCKHACKLVTASLELAGASEGAAARPSVCSKNSDVPRWHYDASSRVRAGQFLRDLGTLMQAL